MELAEVIRPNRRVRRMRGKSDPIDAYAAAATALAEPDLPVPKTTDGTVDAIRQLLVARRSAVKARTAAQTQIKTLLVTAPDPVQAKYRTLTDTALITALSRTRGSDDTTTDATLRALRSLARLNHGGDRHANAALHRIALVCMSYEQRTRDDVARKRAEGKSPKDTICCLKRAIAREIFTLLTTTVTVPQIDDLRPLRHARGISLETVAQHFGVWPMKISTIERGTRRDDDFATTYRQ